MRNVMRSMCIKYKVNAQSYKVNAQNYKVNVRRFKVNAQSFSNECAKFFKSMRKVSARKFKIDAQGHCSKFKSNAKMSFWGLSNFSVSSGCISRH